MPKPNRASCAWWQVEPPPTTTNNHHKENTMNFNGNLSTDGRPIFSMGGNLAWKVRSHRGYVVSLEWVNKGKQTNPCMVIWPERTGSNAVEAGAWCISRRVITNFVGLDANGKCTGRPSEHLIREARLSLNMLDKDQGDEQALSALVDAVVQFAPELVLMPAIPRVANEQAFSEAV
jgi:hypothetical protein